MKKKTAIVYWLIPAEPERELFCEMIRILARQLDAPPFEPHLTICATREDARSARETLKRVRLAPIRLRVKEASYSNLFTKTLFIRFERTRALANLNAALRRAGGMAAGALRDLHMSLLYKNMPLTAKKQLASSVKLPFGWAVFDSIKAVRCPSPTQSRADVKAWRVVASASCR